MITRPRTFVTSRAMAGTLAIALALLVASNARADVIRLQTGGELRGSLESVSDASRAESIEIITLSGAAVEIDRVHVEFVKSRTPDAEEYITRSRELPHTVDDHWALAEWCLLHGLRSQRDEQLRLLLEIDPDHEETRRALGHEFFRGEWMSREDAMALQGYFRHEGRWVTQQELDLIHKTAEQRAAEQQWHPQVRLWVSWLSEVRNKETESLRNLQQIDDPAAIPALVSNMADHDNPSVRGLFVSILSGIGGAPVVESLMAQYLFDAEPDVRRAALESLTPDQYELALDYLVPELRNRDNAVVRRVAVALNAIGDERTVPFLIDSLITQHTFQVMIPAGTATTFTRGPNGQVGMLAPGTATGLPPGLEMALRTGQLPYGAVILPGGPGTQGQRMQTISVSTEVTNAEVLAALETITGEDFGYSEVDWRAWWNLRRQQQAG